MGTAIVTDKKYTRAFMSRKSQLEMPCVATMSNCLLRSPVMLQQQNVLAFLQVQALSGLQQ